MSIDLPEVARVDTDGRLYEAQLPERLAEPNLIDLIGQHAPSSGGGGGGVEAIVLSAASAMSALSGSPSTSGWVSPTSGTAGAGRVSTLDFDGGTSVEYAGRCATLPAAWAATDITLIWTIKDGAATGDVQWQATWTALVDGQPVTVAPPQVSAVGTAPLAGVARTTTIPAAAIPSGVPVMLRFGREPGLAADTLAVDACLIAVALTPAG